MRKLFGTQTVGLSKENERWMPGIQYCEETTEVGVCRHDYASFFFSEGQHVRVWSRAHVSLANVNCVVPQSRELISFQRRQRRINEELHAP
jgi:hypothetical protein